MKVAILSESLADEAAIRILVDGLLAIETESVSHAGLRSRGWPSVRDVLRPVVLQLHYHSDADGLVLVVDSNGTPPHVPEHEVPSKADSKCRLCELRRIVQAVLGPTRPRQGYAPLKTALGLAVPSIEAWLRCDSDPHVSEAAWINGMKSGQLSYSTARLKKDLYGTDRPSLAHETKAMTEAAARRAANLSLLESRFPQGFGALARDLRSW
jgi:hypothetical protein